MQEAWVGSLDREWIPHTITKTWPSQINKHIFKILKKLDING